MIGLECVVARMGDFPLPEFLRNAGQIAQSFAAESNGDIQLSMNLAPLAESYLPDRPSYSAFDLHRATLLLTRNPPPPDRSKRIAVLYANFYAPHTGVFGMMFDRGFATWDDPNDLRRFTSSPREGCAIFLGAIANLRSGIFFEREALFTTMHEMGHLFNLEHVNIPSFMATSRPDSPYPPAAFRFISPHRHRLAQCSTSPYVWPGGAPFAGDNDFASGANRPDFGAASPAFGLELAINLARKEFWKFEPIELDVEIRVAAGVERAFRIPDTVDPGYAAFVLWLENPRGERKRYRSPRYYCAAPTDLEVTPTAPYRRDISIFGQSGGYTFTASGVWRIWAEFDAGKGQHLRSNVVEVNVKPRTSSQGFERAFTRLTSTRSAALLYHRLIRRGASAMKPLVEQIEDPSGTVPVAGLEYALGRALAEKVGLMRSAGARAGDYLKRARDRDELGTVQRAHADRIVEALESR